MLLMILMEKKLSKLLQKRIAKTNQKEFRIEKLTQRKGDNLFVKWKGYDKPFNSWNDEKGIVK